MKCYPNTSSIMSHEIHFKMNNYGFKCAQSLFERNVPAAIATKNDMQKISHWIRNRDTPDRRFGKILDLIYTC